MKVQFRNTRLTLEFLVDLNDKNSVIHRDFIKKLETLEVDKADHLSYSSCNKLINGVSNSSKGWTATIVNPEASISTSKERKASQKDEKRKDVKARKKAEKAAKKNVANGNRNRIGAQKRFMGSKKKVNDSSPKTKSIRPSAIALAVNQTIFQ